MGLREKAEFPNRIGMAQRCRDRLFRLGVPESDGPIRFEDGEPGLKPRTFFILQQRPHVAEAGHQRIVVGFFEVESEEFFRSTGRLDLNFLRGRLLSGRRCGSVSGLQGRNRDEGGASGRDRCSRHR